MSKRISLEHAKELYEKEQTLIQLQKEGKQLPRNDRRRKKYEAMRKRQNGILWRMKDRIKRTGGKMPKHLES